MTMKFVNSQIPQCVYPKIKGPLLVCNSSTTSHYYVKPIGNYLNVDWSVHPSTAGFSFNETQFTTDVTWSATAISDHGYLLYSCDGYSDTLFPQTCCPIVPTGAKKIQDLDDFIGVSSGTSSGDKVANAFNDPLQPLMSIQHTVGTDIVKVSNGVYFIEGQLNLEVTRVEFIGCTFYMGSGAVIYGPRGHLSNAGLLGDFVARDNTHFLGTSCGMWQGIVSTSDSKLYFSGSTIEDAEYAIKWGGCSIAITCDNSTFNNNVVSIFSQHILVTSSNQYYNLGPDPSRFRNCLFNSQSPMTLPFFNGQRAKPQNYKPFAAMYYNDLIQSTSANIKSIPFDEIPGQFCTIQNMPFGIYGINSRIEVFNCRFKNIQPSGNCYTKSCPTAAIYSWYKPTTGTQLLNVGAEDLPGQSALHNEFTDCYFGVKSLGNINSNIFFNSFTHMDLGSLTFPSGRAIMLLDAKNCTLKINHNHIIDHKILSNAIAFNSTGIMISNSGQFHQNIEIVQNTIENNRIGMYLNNINGSNVSIPDFHIGFNSINSTIPDNLLTGNHFGIFTSNINMAVIEGNTILRSQPLSTSPNFQTKMYGMNNVNCTGSEIAANYIQQYGTAMRFVSTCGGTHLRCNALNTCVQGISLANASMSNQGSATDPWDNTWDGFPTPSITTYNRVDGICPPFNWYSRGYPNSTSFSNSFSPEPINQLYVQPSPLPSYNGLSCQGGNGGNGGNYISTLQHLLDIVTSNITYPDYPNEERYNDEEYAFQTLLRDSALAISESDFVQFLQQENGSNRDYFHQVDDYVDDGNITDAILLLNLIVDSNTIEHNKHFTKAIALRLLDDPDAVVTQAELEEQEAIAWTNAWEGGPGVFTARHNLDEEVFDVERNLRRGHFASLAKPDINISIYPNPLLDKAIIYFNKEDGSSINLIIYDFTGRPVMEKKLSSNIVDVSNLKQGIYTFTFFMNDSYQSSSRISIVK